MFFPHRVRNVRPSDRVLEVGPGGTPHPRADVFLEREFADSATACGQRGQAPKLVTDRPIVPYAGGAFPFHDHEFDYVICSHVLEHVDDVDTFVRELCRVAPRGYVEFPTIYYDYLYDFPEHRSLVFHRDNAIFWMPKCETCLPAFQPVTSFFHKSLAAGHTSLIDALAPWMFQGFEWEGGVDTRRTRDVRDLAYPLQQIQFDFAATKKRLLTWPHWLGRRRRAA